MDKNNTDKNIILVHVKYFDESGYFKFENTQIEDIKDQLRSTRPPMVNLAGEQMDALDYVALQQGNEVSTELTVDMNDEQITVYEINKIPEKERSSDNVSRHVHSFAEYLNLPEERENPSEQQIEMQNEEQDIDDLLAEIIPEHDQTEKNESVLDKLNRLKQEIVAKEQKQNAEPSRENIRKEPEKAI